MEKIYLRKAKLEISKQKMPKSLKRRFKLNGYSDLLDKVQLRSAQLFEDNSEACKALKQHLNQILPCIAFYEILKEKAGKEEALRLYDEWAYDEIKRLAKIIRVIAGTGMYKIFPAVFDKFTDKIFGSSAGFESRRPEDVKQFARDMVKCPYYETCRKYGCPELTRFFCHSDDITYGNIHPDLVWERTKTIGTGGDSCDFRLFLYKDKRK